MKDVTGYFDLAALLLQFGRTNRVTYHEDGVTPESDTDHTVMLGVIACAFAERINAEGRRFPQHYNVGLVAQFAFVHDLAEALCGDTNTLRIDQAGRASKEQREHVAREELRRRFAAMPWISSTLDKYEALDTPEARFVKVMDKVLPKLTHALNKGTALREHGIDLAKLAEVNGSQRGQIAGTYGADQPEAVELLFEVHEELVRRLRRAEYDQLTDEQKGYVSYMRGAFNEGIPNDRPDGVSVEAWRRGELRAILEVQDQDG